MQNLLPCGYVILSISSFSKPNIQGPSDEKSEACVEDVDLPMLKNIIMMQRQPFTHLLSACLMSCNRAAASHMQIVSTWPPVSCKFTSIATGGHPGTICMQLAVTRAQIICNWPPVACTSSQLRAKPPVFCKHAARTIIWIKKWRRH